MSGATRLEHIFPAFLSPGREEDPQEWSIYGASHCSGQLGETRPPWPFDYGVCTLSFELATG
jgi:hypothetical protein